LLKICKNIMLHFFKLFFGSKIRDQRINGFK
jgi:hypothetical protein